MIVWLLPAALLVLLSSIFAAAETALFALNRDQLEALKARSKAGAAVLALRDRPARLLALAWTGRLAAGGAAVAVVAVGLGRGASLLDFGLAVAAVGLALILLEIAGRGLGLRRSERVALRLAPALRVLFYGFLPLWLPLEAWILTWVGRGGEHYPRITDREIRALLADSDDSGTIEEHERRLIQRALALDRTRAYDVMTPRVEIFAWPAARTLAQIAPELRTAVYSRVPIYRENLDDIVGILHTRDAYQALISGQRDVPLRDLAHEPFFVPGSIPLNKLLLDFQTRRIHIGIVIDEYGGTDGVVTLEDILEELVGEITDEREAKEELIVRVGRSQIVVDGAAELREINHFLNTSLPQLEHRSLNGYLLEEMGRVPEAGEKTERDGVLFEVLAASETQVLRARLTRLGAKGEARPGPSSREPEQAPPRSDRGTRLVP